MTKSFWISRAAFVAFVIGIAGTGPLRAQVCKDMLYLHQNQVDPKPIKVGQVHGTAVDQDGYAVPQLCVGIFSESEHALLRYAQSDSFGNFAVDTKGLPAGEYRLVGHLVGLCPANAVLDIRSSSHHKKSLVVHMRVGGIDTCSYIEAAKK